MLNFGITRVDAAPIAVPKVSLTCMNTADFGAVPVACEDLLLVGEGVAQDHPRGREVAEHELVALLGDRRRGGDVDDEGDTFCSATWAIAAAGAGVESADQQLGAVGDQLLGARARHLDIGLGVGVHQLDVDSEHLSDQAGRNVAPIWHDWPILARYPDRGNSMPTLIFLACAPAIRGNAMDALAREAAVKLLKCLRLMSFKEFSRDRCGSATTAR